MSSDNPRTICDQIKAAFRVALEGAPELSAQMAAHLTGCSACQLQQESWRRARASWQRFLKPLPEEDDTEAMIWVYRLVNRIFRARQLINLEVPPQYIFIEFCLLHEAVLRLATMPDQEQALRRLPELLADVVDHERALDQQPLAQPGPGDTMRE